MRTGEANLQEERLGLGIAAQPPLRQPANKVVGMRIRRQIPGKGAHALVIIVAPPILLSLLLHQAARGQGFVPFIEVVAPFKVTILVFHHIALVETQWRLEGLRVHFADVDAVIAGLVQVLNPGATPAIGVAHDAGHMRIETGEEAGARRGAGGRCDMTVVEAHAFVDQPVDVWRVHIGKSQRIDCVVALLVSDDENDIRWLSHEFSWRSRYPYQINPNAASWQNVACALPMSVEAYRVRRDERQVSLQNTQYDGAKQLQGGQSCVACYS